MVFLDTMKSKIGLIFALVYVLLCIVLIASQGLFGESFIVIILGLPWSMIFSFFEFGNVAGALLYVMIFAPLVLNTYILYWLGSFFDRS